MNELDTAQKYGNEYYLYLLIWNYEESTPSEVIKIRNPISFFHINLDSIKSYINMVANSSTCIFEINSISVILGRAILEDATASPHVERVLLVSNATNPWN
jgi:hypothetical protein